MRLNQSIPLSYGETLVIAKGQTSFKTNITASGSNIVVNSSYELTGTMLNKTQHIKFINNKAHNFFSYPTNTTSKLNTEVRPKRRAIDCSIRYQVPPFNRNIKIEDDFVVLREKDLIASDEVINMSTNSNSLGYFKGFKLISAEILKPDFAQEMQEQIAREYNDLIEQQVQQQQRSKQIKLSQRKIDRLALWIIILLLLLLVLVIFNPFSEQKNHRRFNNFEIYTTGDFTDQEIIATALNNYQAEYGQPMSDYFEQDLSKVYNLIKKFSWIKEVQIEKKWPNTLTIYTQDYIPLAVWGDGHNEFISRSGKKFNLDLNMTPQQLDKLSGLPIFKGSESHIQFMYSFYLQLNQLLLPLAIQATTIDYQNDYHIEVYLSNDIQVVFDLYDGLRPLNLDSYLENLYIILTQAPKATKFQLEKIDLRYNHGAAIKFKGNKTIDDILNN